VKGRQFHGGPRAALSLARPLHTNTDFYMLLCVLSVKHSGVQLATVSCSIPSHAIW